jgi:hypothetical protein
MTVFRARNAICIVQYAGEVQKILAEKRKDYEKFKLTVQPQLIVVGTPKEHFHFCG